MLVDDELIDRFLDGDASEDEAALITEWLESSANLQRFAQRSELHADLRRLLRRKCIQDRAIETCEPMALAAGSEQQTKPATKAASSRAMTKLAIVAFATAVCLLITFSLRHDEGQPTPPHAQLATIVSEIDALLIHGESSWERTDLEMGEYQLRRGLLHLQFDGGVMVYVEAPAEFNVVSGKHFVLQHGRLSASVPPEGIGFTVITPEAEVIDFGTEFSVDVEGGASEVHVFDGLVRVNPGISNRRSPSKSVDLQASQAVRITSGATELEDISIASDRFIRSFDEPRFSYALFVNQLSPLAFYRMAIRDEGLVSEPSGYPGVVLTGEGKRPPHGKGVFAGGSLRVGVDSIGRGGRIDSPPALTTGQFSLTAFVYRETPAHNTVAATNWDGERGNFALSLDGNGMLQATIRSGKVPAVVDEATSPEPGENPAETGLVTSSTTGRSVLPLRTWRHVVVTADGEQLQFYEDGKLVASKPCAAMAASDSDTVWFGTAPDATQVWDGRIDEVALFNRALNEDEIATLYRTAQKQLARSQ